MEMVDGRMRQWDAYQDKHKTSVDPEKCQGSWKYDESLKEFLKPVTQNANLKKNKCGKKIKSHAQVLGFNAENEAEQKNESKNCTKNANKEIVEEKNNNGLKIVIESMKTQINELLKIANMLCNAVVKDEDAA